MFVRRSLPTGFPRSAPTSRHSNRSSRTASGCLPSHSAAVPPPSISACVFSAWARRRSLLPDTYVRRKLQSSPLPRRRAVFLDSDCATWNLDPEILEEALRERARTKQIAPRCRRSTPLRTVRRHGPHPGDLPSATVCRCSRTPPKPWAQHKVGQPGHFGELAAFSFNGNKIITTTGGGMLVSRTRPGSKRPASGPSRPAIPASPTNTPNWATTTA